MVIMFVTTYINDLTISNKTLQEFNICYSLQYVSTTVTVLHNCSLHPNNNWFTYKTGDNI